MTGRPRPVDDLPNGDLVPPDAARAIVLGGVVPVAGTESVTLAGALGRVVATDQRSGVALPRFDNAAVDGYGLTAEDLARPVPATLAVAGRAPAGRPSPPARPGAAVRILTGAAIPEGVAAVVAHERTIAAGDAITLPAMPPPGANIRRHGEDVSPGTVVVAAGTPIDARHIAILAAAGIARLTVRRRLRIGVLSTGDELVEAGEAPGPSRIVDTNRPMLIAVLGSAAVEVVDLGVVADRRETVAAAIADAAAHLDLLISSGGVAGSDADHLEPAIRAAGGRCRPLKLALRPGKPIAEGEVGRMRILALPGNPVAALVNVLLFGRPMIRRLAGAADTARSDVPARTSAVFWHKAGRTEFVPARIVGHGDDGLPTIEKLGRGGSARLMPLVAADGLAEIDGGVGDVPAGACVRFHPFSTAFAL